MLPPCPTCNKLLTEAQVKEGNKCCSRECAYLNRTKETRVTFNCSYCNISVTRPLSYLTWSGNERRQGGSRFCSKDCFYLSRRTRLEIKCSFCQELFWTIPARVAKGWTCCSRKCRQAAVDQNKLTPEQIADRLYFYGVKHRHGLTKEAYNSLFELRNGKCHICDRIESRVVGDKIKRLDVDHDHTTGRVRGLLCSMCNSLLGYAKDNIKTLERAIKYLEAT